MDINNVTTYLQKILDNSENPGRAVDEFLVFFWGNKLDRLARHDNIWSEITHLAHELEKYDPDPNPKIEDRLAGFFGTNRALTLTKRALKFIEIVQPHKNK